jgi:hypothetical protein
MYGFAYGFIVHVVVGNAAVVVMLRRWLPEVRLWPRIRGNLIAAVGTAVVARLWIAPWASRLAMFILALAVCGVLHGVLLAIFDRQAVLSLLRFVRRESVSDGVRP